MIVGGRSKGIKKGAPHKKRPKKNFIAGSRCRFCFDAEMKDIIDYKNVSLLKSFLTDCGKVISARVSGNCSYCQRKLSQAIKRSRIMALVPFCAH